MRWDVATNDMGRSDLFSSTSVVGDQRIILHSVDRERLSRWQQVIAMW